ATEALDDNISWFTNRNTIVMADRAVAPDGTMTADEVVDQDVAMQTRRGQGASIPDDMRQYSFSIFLRVATMARMTFAGELLNGWSKVQAIVRDVIAAWTAGEVEMWDQAGIVRDSATVTAIGATLLGSDGQHFLDGHLVRVTYWSEPRNVADPSSAHRT